LPTFNQRTFCRPISGMRRVPLDNHKWTSLTTIREGGVGFPVK
jgi:hypothetical protein